MSLTNIKPAGMVPVNRFMGTKNLPRTNTQQVAFTGINYGKAVKSLKLNELWPEIKKLWSTTAKNAKKTEPFFKDLDKALRKIGQTIWKWVQPVSSKV